MIEQLNEFFNRKGINKSGICEEAGVSIQHLNRVLCGRKNLTIKFFNRLCHVVASYGFNPLLVEMQQKELLISFMESLNQDGITKLELAEYEELADSFLGNVKNEKE